MAEPLRVEPAEEAGRVRFAVAPLNLTRREALAFTGWAPKLFDHLERAGAITGRRDGPNGATIYAREELEAVDRKRRGATPAANDDGLDAEI